MNKSLEDAGAEKIEDIIDPAERERLQAINDMLQAQLELKKQLEKDANNKANEDTSAVVNEKTEHSLTKKRTVYLDANGEPTDDPTKVVTTFENIGEDITKTESLQEHSDYLDELVAKRRELATAGQEDTQEYKDNEAEIKKETEKVQELSSAVSEQMDGYETDADGFAQYKDEYVAGTNAMTAATKALANAQDDTGVDTTNLDIFAQKVKNIKNDMDNGDSQQSDWNMFNGLGAFSGMTGESVINAYCSNPTYSSDKNALTLTVKELAVDDEANISFIMPAKITKDELNIIVKFISTVPNEKGDGTEQKTDIKTSLLYKSIPNADGTDVKQNPSVMEAGKYYVIQWFPESKHFYFVGQQQSHAMVKLVDTIPTGDALKKEKTDENCDNLEYVCVTDPSTIDDLYNAKFSIEKIGRRNLILSGGDYENYTTDEKAMEVAKYELWKKARLTDGLVVPILLVPWLDVNEKIQYAAKYLNSKTPVDWIIKSFSINLGEGTMSLTMSRYFPYYPYIVGHGKDEDSKYNLYQDWMLDQYFPDLRSDVSKDNNPSTTT